MMTESKKRSATLGILSRLRQQGMPDREERIDGMFDSLLGEEKEGSEEDKEPRLPDVEIEDDTASPPIPSSGSVAKRKPAANQAGAKAFMKAFKGVK